MRGGAVRVFVNHAGADQEPRLPGVLPAVWGGVPGRNEAFTGRDTMLARVRNRLGAAGRSVVQALNGVGGVGKTQLAAEYAWRFAGDYDAVWWVNAEQTDLIAEQLTGFAIDLGLVDADSQTTEAIAALRRYCPHPPPDASSATTTPTPSPPPATSPPTCSHWAKNWKPITEAPA